MHAVRCFGRVSHEARHGIDYCKGKPGRMGRMGAAWQGLRNKEEST